jgi:hypothetical protein
MQVEMLQTEPGRRLEKRFAETRHKRANYPASPPEEDWPSHFRPKAACAVQAAPIEKHLSSILLSCNDLLLA